MVTTVDEVRRGPRACSGEARASLAAAGVPCPERVEVGIMVEVPAAALLAEAFVPHVDFFSLGTNDLAQYVLAADRGNADVAALADALHPAVLRLIERVARAAAAAGRRVAVCGEVAGDPLAIPLLLGLGVTELSMAPRAHTPAAKQAVRATDSAPARRLAAAALAAESADEVRRLAGHRDGRGQASGGPTVAGGDRLAGSLVPGDRPDRRTVEAGQAQRQEGAVVQPPRLELLEAGEVLDEQHAVAEQDLVDVGRALERRIGIHGVGAHEAHAGRGQAAGRLRREIGVRESALLVAEMLVPAGRQQGAAAGRYPAGGARRSSPT